MSVSPRIHKNEAESVTVFLVLMGALLKTFLFLLTLECENFSAFSFIIYLFGAGIPALNSILHLPKYEKGELPCRALCPQKNSRCQSEVGSFCPCVA